MSVQSADELLSFRPVDRVGMLVVHSNPLAIPGAGDAGGMTVYVREMARAMAARGVACDIFTRRDDPEAPEVTPLYPKVRVIQIDAGDPRLPKEAIPAHLPEFTSNLVDAVTRLGVSYDLLHSHYWLSGKVAAVLKNRWNIPFVHTFHTLGRVKNEFLRDGDPVEPEGRLLGEGRVIDEACAIVASTMEERSWLIDLYAAHPERVHLVSPGVDHDLFTPADRDAAKRFLGLEGKKVLLFVGRLQPLKGVDTAIRALHELVTRHAFDLSTIKFLIVGGASGSSGATEPEKLRALARHLGVEGSIEFVSVQPQERLPSFYQAADVCLVPSHVESFGLVALEAQACGIPVVASSVGGLRSIVNEGQSGFLVSAGDHVGFGDATARILSNPCLSALMAKKSVGIAKQYSWDRSAEEMYGLYSDSQLVDCDFSRSL